MSVVGYLSLYTRLSLFVPNKRIFVKRIQLTETLVSVWAGNTKGYSFNGSEKNGS